MKNEIIKFEFNGQAVDFEPSKTNVMVNATQMANIFGKKVEAFMRNEITKDFISECLKSENSRFLGIENESDLFLSKQKSGTWMHRILALKFAAWLNPAFEVWVYATIEQLLFGEAAERNQKLNRKAEIAAERKRLSEKLSQNEDFRRLQELHAEEMRLGKEMAYQEKAIVERQLTLLFDEEKKLS